MTDISKWVVTATLFLMCVSRLTADPAKSLPTPMLIPQPVQCRMSDGAFILSDSTRLVYSRTFAETARLAAAQLGLRGAILEAVPQDDAVNLLLDSSLATEGYRLDIAPRRITIAGGSSAGVFYGIQTLRQLAGPKADANSSSVSCLLIQDQPRFSWRGLMLDCSRTFQSVDYLRKTIDRLAFYKMNVLHLHLTDDQGWRVEIKKYPELTKEGARFSAIYKEPQSHQGFYTQADLKNLVKYAALRGVTIVPEIEMPGHSLAVLVCRPDLSCTGKIPNNIFPFSQRPAITEDILCAGNEATFRFLQDVVDEVVEIFPAKYVHIGGDEAPKTRWKACSKCQIRIKTEGLRGEDELQSYFVRRMEQYLTSKGRCLIGWDEILEGGLAPGAAVMSWRGVDGGIAAAKAGHNVVMSPTSHCYFDYDYRAIDERRAYSFEPVAGLSPEQARRILGLQANFWSHIDREPALVDKQIFPRLLSIAERGWSPASATDWNSFEPRLRSHYEWLRRFGIAYQGS